MLPLPFIFIVMLRRKMALLSVVYATKIAAVYIAMLMLFAVCFRLFFATERRCLRHAAAD